MRFSQKDETMKYPSGFIGSVGARIEGLLGLTELTVYIAARC